MSTFNIEDEIALAQSKLEDLRKQKLEVERKERELKEKLEAEKREILRQEARAKKLATWGPVADQVVEALKAAGFTKAFWYEPENTGYGDMPKFSVYGPNVWDGDSRVEFVAATDNSFRRNVTGWRITVGTYGNTKSFPMKKDGSYSFAKIAAEVKERHEASVVRRQKEDQAKKVSSASKHIRARLGAKFGYTVGGDSGYTCYDGGISIDVSTSDSERVWLNLGKLHLTEEQATEVLALLQKMGRLPSAGMTK